MAALFADASYPLCERVAHNVVVFSGARLLAAPRREALSQLHQVLADGPWYQVTAQVNVVRPGGTAHLHRMANLLQVSSAFGKPMESIDRPGMARAIFPALAQRYNSGELRLAQRDAVIAAVGDGYSFPTNLDTDPPLKDLAPPTEQCLLAQAVEQHWAPERLGEALAERQRVRTP